MTSCLTKIAAAVVTLSVGVSVSASGYAPVCSKYDVSIPCQTSGWDVGFEALALEPMSQALFYGIFNGLPRTQVDPTFGFAFRVEGSYHFGHGSDVNLNWLRFQNRFSTPTSSVTSGGTTSAVQGRFRLNFDQANFERGQLAYVSSRVNLRSHFGVTIVRLNDNRVRVNTQSGATTGQRTNISTNSFDGAGLRAGFDSLYRLTGGFSLAAHAAGSLVVGDTEVIQTSTASGSLTAFPYKAQTDTRTVVPMGEVKLGLNHTCETSMGRLSLEGGYYALGAMHILHTVPGSSSPTLPNPETLSDFGLHGFYLNAKIDTSVV